MCALWDSLGTAFHERFQVALTIMVTPRRPLWKFSGIAGKSLIERWDRPVTQRISALTMRRLAASELQKSGPVQ
jgi:hypothetical protein